MSMGGDFYSITEDQLTRLLEGDLAYGDFLYDSEGEQPRECFSQFERLWYELSKVTQEENGCGVEICDVIPEICTYSYPDDVAETSEMLAGLDEATIQERCEEEGIETPYQEVWAAVQGLKDFYQRAANNGDAVLFRVT
ncbi:MAG: DUF1877 family protein [Pseudomonadota bacterium]